MAGDILYSHTWHCGHSEIVDNHGRRINLLQVNQAGPEPTQRAPPYGCPACRNHLISHLDMMTRPRPDATPLPPLFFAGLSQELDPINHGLVAPLVADAINSAAPSLRPTAAVFVPRPEPEHVVNPYAAFTLVVAASNVAQATEHNTNFLRQCVPRNVHRIGKLCPDNDPTCHWHHSDVRPYHISWQNCGQALRAVKATYYASVDQPNDWTGARMGWSEEHGACHDRTERNDARCAYHHECYQELRKTI